MNLQANSLLQGRYRLVGSIARGGMAEVWEGVDEVLTRPVALKMLHPHLAADEAFRERFRREAVAAARLSHPNIVATFDTGEDDDVAFIVMELVSGRTLRQLLSEQGTLPPTLVATIGMQVARALAHAHEAGLIHRDVKPANILLSDSEPGSPLQVKVADFGIARAASRDGADLTQPGALLGTAKYLAPEQIQGGEPGPRSDVYALGVVLYELLAGRPPFTGESEVATAMAHLHTEPLRLRQIRAGIPRSLDSIVSKAMARDPDDRYQSAAEFASALDATDLRDDDAVPAIVRDPTPPSGIAPTFGQTERRWLVPAGLIVVVSAALIALGVMFSQSETGQELLGGVGVGAGANTPGAPISPARVRSFDPEGPDKRENEQTIAAVFDGNPDTAWRTDRYNSRDFGGLKSGVGVIVELGEPAALNRLRVSSPSGGWSAKVYVADSPGTTLAEWGRPAAGLDNIEASTEFDLGGAKGRAVLLWITRLADDVGGRPSVEVQEITVEGRSDS